MACKSGCTRRINLDGFSEPLLVFNRGNRDWPDTGWAGGCYNNQIGVRSIMSVDDGVTLWLRQLEAGDQEAARLLWQRYYRELVELARARLGQTPRRIADEEDVALSVLRCLCEGAAKGQFAAVVNRQELWQLLATITIRKVINQQRHLKKQKRGGGRVRGDSVLQVGDGD